MFSMECAQLKVPRREGETDEEYGTRSETLLNSVITDLAIDLRYVVLAHPTKRLKALLGHLHLADVKTLLPGSRYRNDKDGTTSSVVNARQEELSLDSHVPSDDNTPFQDKLKTFGVDGRVLGPTVGAWCETSTDFDLLVELIAHALADEETSTIQVAHHQSVARQKCKLVADFGVQMHLAWTQNLLDNREFVQMKGRFPSFGPRSGHGSALTALLF